jgi:hypothetical protein
MTGSGYQTTTTGSQSSYLDTASHPPRDSRHEDVSTTPELAPNGAGGQGNQVTGEEGAFVNPAPASSWCHLLIEKSVTRLRPGFLAAAGVRNGSGTLSF